MTVSTRELAQAAVMAALEKKGVYPVLLDLTDEATYTDYLLIVSGRSERHTASVLEGIRRTMHDELGRTPIGVENTGDGQWSLLDYGELVVHVFHHPIREFYDLEGLWSQAPRVHIDVPADSQLQYSDAYGM